MPNVVPLHPQGPFDRDAVAIAFFKRVLPSTGLYCACVKKSRGGFIQTFHGSIEGLWNELREKDRSGRDVYFAPASFSSNERTVEACAEKRSLHLDIDYGPGHAKAGYETDKDAVDALKVFCPKVGLPLPMVVKSGGGFHVWWPFKEALPRAKWQRYADGLKAACLEHGLRADHSLTINSVVILRPPGTFNRKLAIPRPVELGPEWLVGPYDWPDELLGYVANTVIRLRAREMIPPRPAYLDAYEFPSEAFPDHYPSVDANKLADACGQYGRFRKTGVLPEPVWSRLIAGMPFVEDGEKAVHHWSKTDPRYKPEETQGKFDRARKLRGPPLCSGFERDFDDETRAICLACPKRGVVVTPLALGRSDEPEATDDVAKPGGAAPSFVEWEKTAGGAVKSKSYRNTAIAISALKIRCRHDVFHNRKLIEGDAPENLGPELSGASERAIFEMIVYKCRFEPTVEHVRMALERECEKNRFDPVVDYLAGLKWDGKPRLDHWLADYLGAEGTPLNCAFGRKTLIAGVRRVRRPGCKFDHLLVLEGPQGAGKSTALRVLAVKDENFSDQPIKWDDPKQQREATGGVWIHEISELVGLRKADVEAIKSFLSRQNDRARPAYGRSPEDQHRRGISIGTANGGKDGGYLTDPTGARRFWPVQVGRIDLEGLKQDRDQLWAEAAYWEAQGEELTIPAGLHEAARIQQEARRIHDPWTDILDSVKGERVETSEGPVMRVSSADLLARDLDLQKQQMTPQAAARVATIMRQLGWNGPKLIRLPKLECELGPQVKGYERPVGRDAI